MMHWRETQQISETVKLKKMANTKVHTKHAEDSLGNRKAEIHVWTSWMNRPWYDSSSKSRDSVKIEDTHGGH